ncbi:RidA family protein [Nocardiopsis rhodophaea]|uniref:RidA family protein n=1 Tax=Nocardiopsis rhodophaea TaxID=280238 RepID=A0ABN2TK37_9ACTN
MRAVNHRIELIGNDRLTDTVDYAYAAAVHAPPRTIFTAGACPLDAAGATVGVGDYAAQADQAMGNLIIALQGAGAQLTDVVKTTVYVAASEQADLVAAWEVVRARFGEHGAPSTLLGVTVLGYDDQLVEIEAVAVAP